MVFHVSSLDLFAKFIPIAKEKFSPVNFVIMLLEKKIGKVIKVLEIVMKMQTFN